MLLIFVKLSETVLDLEQTSSWVRK